MATGGVYRKIRSRYEEYVITNQLLPDIGKRGGGRRTLVIYIYIYIYVCEVEALYEYKGKKGNSSYYRPLLLLNMVLCGLASCLPIT